MTVVINIHIIDNIIYHYDHWHLFFSLRPAALVGTPAGLRGCVRDCKGVAGAGRIGVGGQKH